VRVIAGKFGSRTLKGPRGLALRPTSDRLRETLFNILGTAVEDSVFVDVYAGTGAVGIEALSRGARRAVFIENHKTAIALIRRNLAELGIEQNAEVLQADAAKGLALLAKKGIRVDFVFLDPPYEESKEYAKALNFLGKSSLLVRGGRVIVEHEKRRKLAEETGNLKCVRKLEQGDGVLSFFQWQEPVA
jgi:16S rRNA (guanine(966)-N(2))-methyltransferase RsmD